MSDFMTSQLWRSTLANQANDPQERSRDMLRNAFLVARDRAWMLADEIHRDLPEFTVHGVSHLDALWDMADLLIGKDISLTPAEAFVLGMAFLIHDLGMGVAAYPGGLAQLKTDPNWMDLSTSLLKRELGRLPTNEEKNNLPLSIQQTVTSELLRLRHAQHAETLAFVSWTTTDGRDTYHLIESVELRQAYGAVIGQVAHSHWWPISQLREKLATKPLLGPPTCLAANTDWTVDWLKLACLLRTCDAIQIDGRRAPGFLRALRKPQGYGDLHWVFQGHVHTPVLNNDRIAFTSGQPFVVSEAQAWWVGFELMQNADRELRQVNTLLVDIEKPYRLAAISVAGADEPERLQKYIPTVDWTPVDARIHVSNISALVRNLGGSQLYGKAEYVPLRELIQNASDAVRARRLLQDRAENWGDITVRTGEDENGIWIQVEDNGVGMSPDTLSGPFLDFGQSFWNSNSSRQELPGLQATGFEATGRYGIGFFSTFMWGSRIQVRSRRYTEGSVTHILEFAEGANTRPILRKALVDEGVQDNSTVVRIWLDEAIESFSPLCTLFADPELLRRTVAWLCPALDVNVTTVAFKEAPIETIKASDWTYIDKLALASRIRPRTGNTFIAGYEDVVENIRPILSTSGEIVGRAAIHDRISGYDGPGIISVGGMRESTISFIGILKGKSITAARRDAVLDIESSSLMNWANEQGELLAKLPEDSKLGEEIIYKFAQIVRWCGGKTKNLRIAKGLGSNNINHEYIVNFKGLPDRIILVQKGLSMRFEMFDWYTQYPEMVVTSDGNLEKIISSQFHSELQDSCSHPWWQEHRFKMSGAVIEALAEAWAKPIEAVLDASDLSLQKLSSVLGISVDEKNEYSPVCIIICNPQN